MRILLMIIASLVLSCYSLCGLISNLSESYSASAPEIINEHDLSNTQGCTDNAIAHYSELDGYWVGTESEDSDIEEDEYFYTDYYVEIDGDSITILDYSKYQVLKSTFTVSEDSKGAEGALILHLVNTDLAYDDQSTYGSVGDFVYCDGHITFSEYYNYDPDTLHHYVLIPTDEGPFDNLMILDEEYLDSLQGDWMDPESPHNLLRINGNTIYSCFIDEESEEEPYIYDSWSFHIVCDKDYPDYIYLLGEDLITKGFDMYSYFAFRDGQLYTNMMVLDADWDTSMHFEKVSD